jgi:hypothetical protein
MLTADSYFFVYPKIGFAELAGYAAKMFPHALLDVTDWNLVDDEPCWLVECSPDLGLAFIVKFGPLLKP